MNTPRNPGVVHPPIGRYVHQIEVTNPTRLLFISGQVGMEQDGTIPEDPIDQLGVAVENVVRNLGAAGLGVGALTKMTIYAVGELDPARRRSELDQHLGEHVACSTFLYVAGLARPEYKVEVDAWAAE
jgi:enamine deaminase RidA (YjgF/YER057c/UK114 family)